VERGIGGRANAYADRDAITLANPDEDSYSNPNVLANANADALADADAKPDCYSNAYADRDAITLANSDCYSNRHADADARSDCYSSAHADRDADADIGDWGHDAARRESGRLLSRLARVERRNASLSGVRQRGRTAPRALAQHLRRRD